MKFIETLLPGIFLIELELITDERGFFSRTFCREEFLKRGLNPHLQQCNLSYNQKKGTLRGMHYQESPHEEAKLVRCTRGSIYDVVIDLKSKKWIGVELSGYKMLYIPEGCAHGFQTLEDDTEVFYQMSSPFVKEAARGIRWDDPYFKISWPVEEKIISEKDQSYENCHHGC